MRKKNKIDNTKIGNANRLHIKRENRRIQKINENRRYDKKYKQTLIHNIKHSITPISEKIYNSFSSIKSNKISKNDYILENLNLYDNPENTLMNLNWLIYEHQKTNKPSKEKIKCLLKDNMIKDPASLYIFYELQKYCQKTFNFTTHSEVTIILESLNGKNPYDRLKKMATVAKSKSISEIKKEFNVEISSNEIGILSGIMPFTISYCEHEKNKYLAGNKGTKKEKVTEKFTSFIENSVHLASDAKFSVSNDTSNKLMTAISEILDNAEEHGNSTGTSWAFAGCLIQRENENNEISYECHAFMISFGDSIGKTMLKTQDELTNERLGKYISQHNTEGLRKATLATVISLQDKMSAKDQSDLKRGMGSMDFIEAVKGLGCLDEKFVQAVIISGRNYIRMQGTDYLNFDTNSPNIRSQYFNKENNSSLPLDKNAVKSLKYGFPGTIVSFKFALNFE